MKKQKNNSIAKLVVISLAGFFIFLDLISVFHNFSDHISYIKEKRERAKEERKPKYEYYSNGILKYKKENGIEEYYRENGTLCYYQEGSIYQYYDDEEKAISSEWNEQRDIKKQNGEYKGYSKNGKLLSLLNYRNGRYNGIQKVYFNNADELYSVREYDNGVPIGIHKTYFKSGNLESTTNYTFGRDRKLITRYYENGNIEQRVELFYSNSGEVIREDIEKYKADGIPEYNKVTDVINSKEKFITYYENGRVKNIVFNEENHRLGIGRKYYPNGDLNIKNYYGDEGNLVSEVYYEERILMSRAVYDGKHTYEELIFYTENREDGTKYYELKIENGKKVERFFSRAGDVVYEKFL